MPRETEIDPAAVSFAFPPEASAPVNGSDQLAGIEVLRFVCGLSVLLWHYQHFFFMGPDLNPESVSLHQQLPGYALLAPFYNHGAWAVEVFWTISGFIFYWRYANRISHGSVHFFDFSILRFSRLYPLHFATLILVALGQFAYHSAHAEPFIYTDNNLSSFFSQLLFASNWFQWEPYSFNGPVWSVSAEILVYVAFFAIAKMFEPTALLAALAAAVSALLLKSHILEGLLSRNVLECGLFFFAGGLAQRLFMQRLALPVVGCLAAVPLIALSLHFREIDDRTMLALAVCAVVSFARLGGTRAGSILRRLSFLGNATYATYLIHFPMQLTFVILIDTLGYSRSIFFDPIMFFGYFAAVLAASLAVYRWFEKPAQNWIRNRLLASSVESNSAGSAVK